jgi:hypothetical protein
MQRVPPLHGYYDGAVVWWGDGYQWIDINHGWVAYVFHPLLQKFGNLVVYYRQ